jgi:acetolactate synthase-1/2/3 large subunit
VGTVAQQVAETLVAYDTDYFFCLTGGDQALWIALRDAGISVVNCRSEHAAAYMADGYARVSGRPGFVYGQHGPGVANVAAGLADPYWALSPVVSLTSATAVSAMGRYQYQELDQLPLHDSVTIWNKAATLPERVPPLLREAIRAATARVPGPVHLEIPSDVLSSPAGEAAVYREPGVGTVGERRVPPPAGAMNGLVERLRAARRPVILAGSGVVLSEAWAELTEFAGLLRVPVVTSVGGKGSIDERDDLAAGVVGRYSRTVANDILAEADCVLALGTRLGGLVTNGWRGIPADAEILHVDADASVLGQNYRETAAVVADIKLALHDALDAARADDDRQAAAEWAESVAARVRAWRSAALELADKRYDDGLHPAAVITEIADLLTPQDLLVADTGYMAAWAGVLYPAAAGKTFLRAAGSLGWAFPGALGATLARPERTTVAVTGDGGFGYHLAELETALRWNIPTVTVVLNNGCLAFEYHDQRYLHGGRVLPEMNDFTDVSYAAVATAFGAHGVRVDDRKGLAAALKETAGATGPTVIEVMTSREAVAPVQNFAGILERAV